MITAETALKIENNFAVGSRIYYALYAPDGFKNAGVRMQISKQDDKVSNWGFSIIMSRDIYLDLSQKVFRDYIYLRQKGHYIIQFFYLEIFYLRDFLLPAKDGFYQHRNYRK